MFTKKNKEYIEKEFNSWKNKYPEKEIPRLNRRKRSEWLSEVFLAKDGNDISISGGGKVLLWFALCGRRTRKSHEINRQWEKHLEETEKWGHIEQYIDILKFRERERLLGLNLLKDMPAENINKLIEKEDY